MEDKTRLAVSMKKTLIAFSIMSFLTLVVIFCFVRFGWPFVISQSKEWVEIHCEICGKSVYEEREYHGDSFYFRSMPGYGFWYPSRPGEEVAYLKHHKEYNVCHECLNKYRHDLWNLIDHWFKRVHKENAELRKIHDKERELRELKKRVDRIEQLQREIDRIKQGKSPNEPEWDTGGVTDFISGTTYMIEEIK